MFMKVLLLALPLFVVAQSNCSDDRNFRWTYSWQGRTYTKGCNFLTNNQRRQMNHCNRREGGTRVKDRCRRSCGNCGSGPAPFPPPPTYGGYDCTGANRTWIGQTREYRGYLCCIFYNNPRCGPLPPPGSGHNGSNSCGNCFGERIPPRPAEKESSEEEENVDPLVFTE